jgi:transposase
LGKNQILGLDEIKTVILRRKKMSKKRMVWDETAYEILVKLYVAGDTLKDIADHFGVQLHSVASQLSVLRRQGVELPNRRRRTPIDFGKINEIAKKTKK